MVARVASKVLFGLRNSSGHQHGQAPGAEIERVIFYSKRALRRQPPSWLRRIEVILTDIRNDPLRAQRHARSTVSRQRQHNNPAIEKLAVKTASRLENGAAKHLKPVSYRTRRILKRDSTFPAWTVVCSASERSAPVAFSAGRVRTHSVPRLRSIIEKCEIGEVKSGDNMEVS